MSTSDIIGPRKKQSRQMGPDSDGSRRAVVFAHHDRDNLVDDYVVYYCRKLRAISDDLCFISTSNLPASELDRLNGLADEIKTRENRGFDFESYRLGLARLDYDDFDEIILCNDSVFGPLFPLENLFAGMASSDCDFWGITQSLAFAYHIQSYFLVFKKSAFKSRAMHNFWHGLPIAPTKEDIIQKYEVRLSQALIQGGLKPGVYIDSMMNLKSGYSFLLNRLKLIREKGLLTVLTRFLQRRGKMIKSMDPRYSDITVLDYTDTIKKQGIPFIKVKAFRENPFDLNIRKQIRAVEAFTGYDADLIRRFLKRIG